MTEKVFSEVKKKKKKEKTTIAFLLANATSDSKAQIVINFRAVKAEPAAASLAS